MNNAPHSGSPAGLSLPEKVIQHITLTDVALRKSAAMEKAAAATQAAVRELIPQVVDTMLKFERIQPGEREKLAALLQDPAETLKLLLKTAGHRNVDELARLGGPVKTASDNGRPAHNPASSLTSPHVGARTTGVKQSDVALFQALQLPVPRS